jgi:hypothetical protein
MSDAAAKRGLWVAIILGSALGLLWGAPRYGAIHVTTWNLMGLTVILTIALWCALILLVTMRRSKRDSSPPPAE